MDRDVDQAPHAAGTTAEGGNISATEPPVPRVGSDGKPVYDQEFFLALARCGKDVWNKWRAEQTDRVIFAGVDFQKTENAGINFFGFVFGTAANFSDCIFGTGEVMFAGASFGDYADLSDAIFRPNANLFGATFGHSADLSGATFGDSADLSDATFGNFANLFGATFRDSANLAGATFGYQGRLSGTTFGDWADLSGSTFAEAADLSGATFGSHTHFSGGTFGDAANLSKANFGYWANLSGATFRRDANLSGAIFGDWVNLSGATFGPRANLSDATFGNFANLSGATFGPHTNLSGATFGSSANLSGAIFGAQTDLSGTSFGHSADLSGASFGPQVDLSGASFGASASLSGATFGDMANLSSAIFGPLANLSGASWGALANLSGATFGHSADLSGASWGALADLSGATFGNLAKFPGCSSDEWTSQRSKLQIISDWPEDRKEAFLQWPNSTASRPNGLSSISFAFTRFRGHADFSNREMGENVDFRSARFGQPPRFDSMANVDLYGAKIRFMNAWFPRVFGWTTRSVVANQLRRLRQMAEESKNHDLERDLYIEERKAERGIYFVHYLAQGWNDVQQRWRKITSVQSGAAFSLFACWQIVQTTARLLIHLGWVGVMFFYWLLADYGRSFVRPFTALLLSIVLFHTAYWLILRPQPTQNLWPSVAAALSQALTRPAANDPPFARAVRAFSLANAVPFVGALTLDRDVKERLICGDRPVDEKKAADQAIPLCVPIPPLRFQALALLQTIFSGLCVFFIALALRNYFRMR